MAHAFRFPHAPARIKALPVDHRGFPVPWFVQWYDDTPNFLVVDHRKLRPAVEKRLCWICGHLDLCKKREANMA